VYTMRMLGFNLLIGRGNFIRHSLQIHIDSLLNMAVFNWVVMCNEYSQRDFSNLIHR
jgi:hypothetical protein